MFEYKKLKGKIKEVYDTQAAVGEAMVMSRSALSQRLNGETQWTPVEIVKACGLLEIPIADAHLYFFALKV